MRAVVCSGTSYLTAAIVLIGGFAPAAVAHGPCGCVQPRLIEVGGQIRIASPATPGAAERRGYPAYRVLFNPRRDDLGIAPGHLATAHRADVPTTTVLDRPRDEATRNARFRVPENTPPGVYMVLIFDGGEGGAHNTWDYVHVIDPHQEDGAGVVDPRGERPEQAARARRAAAGGAGSGGPGWPVLGGVGVGCLLIGAVGGAAVRGRRA